MIKIDGWMIISRSTVLVELLNAYWAEHFFINFAHFTPENTSTSLSNESRVLMVIDLSTVTLLEACKIQNTVVNKGKEGRVIYLHYPTQIDVSHILHLKTTVGIFHCDCSLADISNGLIAILRGETIISEGIINERKLSAGYANLTQREHEVLLSLLSGNSNDEIAEKLFVSERTIRTHLYRIYKKIGVSTRIQAILWVQQNFYFQPPSK